MLTQVLYIASLAGSALAADHVVKVGVDSSGQDAFAFTPPTVQAAKGDTVSFQFQSSEHSVLQGMSSKACQPMSGGFFSGGITTTGAPSKQFVITINDTNPIWYFCDVPEHCQMGMVGVINGDMSDFNGYANAAAKTSSSGTPSSSGPTGGSIEPIGSSSSGGGSGGMGGGSSGGGGGSSSGGGAYGGSGSAASLGVAGGAVAFGLVGLAMLGI